MAPQASATVNDEEYDWINQLADDLDISNSKVVARCVRAVKATDNPHEVLEPWREAELTPMELQAELQELRARVAALEDDREEIHTPAPGRSQRAAARPDAAENITADWVAETADWSVAESAETDAKNEALADAYEQLRDAGSMDTPQLVDVYHDYDLSVAESTFRREVLSVLNTLPHVTKPGSGQSTWHYNEN